MSSTWVEIDEAKDRDASPILAPPMKMLKITAGPFTLRARLEESRAPKTVAVDGARVPGAGKHTAIEDAPGRYVKSR